MTMRLNKYMAMGFAGIAICLVAGYFNMNSHHFRNITPTFMKINRNTSDEGDVSEKLQSILDKLNQVSSAQTNPSDEVLAVLKDVREILLKLSTKISRPKFSDDARPIIHTFKNPDVCPEPFAYKRLNHGYPNFYKGFNMVNCTEVPQFNTLLTMVYNFVNYSSKDLPHIPKLLHSVNKVYPRVAIIAALPSASKLTAGKFNDTTFVQYGQDTMDTDIWNQLIAKVKTKYVYIGRNVIHFTWFDRLERLVREVNNLGAYAVGASFRTLRSGIWSTGCEQTTLRNYTLVYEYGYRRSAQECMKCDHVEGPFVTKTKLMTEFPLKSAMTATSGFAMWFLAAKKEDKPSFTCPDSMSFVRDDSQLPTTKNDWRHLVEELQVEKILPPHTPPLVFSCTEANTHCNVTYMTGMALSHCCMKKLIGVNKLVMRLCVENNLTCEVQGGTLLGSIKFNGILPWEVDGDFYIESSDFDAFEKKIGPTIIERGYRLTINRKGRYFVVRYIQDWFVEVFANSNLDTRRLAKQGLSPTRVYYDGAYVATAASPGLYARNRYGEEAFQHVQHWDQLGMKTGWVKYSLGKFTKCPKPGHHACLDQYVADGNLQFRLP